MKWEINVTSFSALINIKFFLNEKCICYWFFLISLLEFFKKSIFFLLNLFYLILFSKFWIYSQNLFNYSILDSSNNLIFFYWNLLVCYYLILLRKYSYKKNCCASYLRNQIIFSIHFLNGIEKEKNLNSNGHHQSIWSSETAEMFLNKIINKDSNMKFWFLFHCQII